MAEELTATQELAKALPDALLEETWQGVRATVRVGEVTVPEEGEESNKEMSLTYLFSSEPSVGQSLEEYTASIIRESKLLAADALIRSGAGAL